MANKKKSENTEQQQTQKRKKRRDDERFDDYDKVYEETDVKSDKKDKKKKEKKPVDPSAPKYQVIVAFLIALSLFIVICYAFPEKEICGKLGGWIHDALFGIFSGAAFLIPFLLVIHAIYLKRDVKNGAAVYKIFFSLAIIIFTSVMLNTGFYNSMGSPEFDQVKIFWENGQTLTGGGVVGGVLGSVMILGVGKTGTFIFSTLLLVIFAIFLFGLTPSVFWKRIAFYYLRMCETRQKRKKERAEEALRAKEEEERKKDSAIVVSDKANGGKRADIDEDIFSDDYDIPTPDRKRGGKDIRKDTPASKVNSGVDERSATEQTKDTPPVRETRIPITTYSEESEKRTVVAEPKINDTANDIKSVLKVPSDENDFDDEDDLFDDITFDEESNAEIKSERNDPASASVGADPVRDELRRTLDMTRKKMREAENAGNSSAANNGAGASESAPITPAPPPEPEYIFPPIDLLSSPPAKNGSVSDDEIQARADRLIETLHSFNVRANIVNISRGPTITRYEIGLEAGTRVRAITNLVDDISLALATSGVRIEGVIPGKSAIGIEVPNETKETVYLRSLIENPKFSEAKSRITTALGRGVAGEPIYLDIAKMPHLLIAGTTGSGKSVCINTMLMSVLYKAKPTEVKLVLIDPKKVEFNKYNGIPHLLVPVVYDSKKAAGALHWCVTEMERRFDLIESQNVRNIEGYNKAVEDDPTKEKLTQIVIVIDELADLMMTASDDVEASICRLAQKARAAGMHLIVGTQRPSVDVITGLIKANIPSRIAFTVMSQVDSRTIIDTAGAEKLIGRGDMLYAPIGSTKPMRVQGAFVSDDELENVINFVKNSGNTAEYSDEIMNQIEKEAALCGQKKGKVRDDDDDSLGDDEGADDPKLKSAIKLAVESGKISTSLIQRKLSLGYGRAAKLIDVMEKRGIVSAPEGQKPREVLISKEQYFEMMMNDEGADTESEENTGDDEF